MKKNLKITLAVTLVASLILAGAAVAFPSSNVYADALDGRGTPGTPMGAGGMGGTGLYGTGLALTPLSADEAADLQQAILEEYGALNLYNAVIAQFGSVAPFSQVALAEQMHVNALIRQATKYGVEVPANPGLKTTPTFATLASACDAGVAAEKADAALYDTLIAGTSHTDLVRVYQSLQSASLNSHLPAFEACN